MQRNFKFFAPLGLLCLILLVDKLVLWPALRNAGRRDTTPMENIAINLDRLLKLEIYQKQSHPDTYRAPVFFLGSSRSEMFQAMDPELIRKASGLNPDTRTALLARRYETRGIVRAADAWLQYVMLDVIIRSQLKPEFVLIEMSPEMFNANSPYTVLNHIKSNVYDKELLWDLFSNSYGDVRKEAALRLTFLSYNYGLRPERVFRNLANGSDYLASADGPVLLLSMQSSVKVLPPDYQDFRIDNIPPQDYKKRFVDYTNHLLKDNILKEYEFSPSEGQIFKLLVDRLKANRVKAIFWNPPVHPELARKRYKIITHLEIQTIIKKIKKSGYPYVKVDPENLNCKLWTDASHLSDRCAPQTMQYILHAAAKNLDNTN